MRKHTRILAAAMTIVEAIVIISLTGCSGKKVDYGNESESKETKNMSALADIKADSDWKENFTIQTGNGEKTVYINANIVVPDFDNMSVVEVENVKIDADYKKRFLDLYFGGNEYYYHDPDHYTVDELNEVIEDWQKTQDDTHSEWLEQQLAEYRDKLETAKTTYTVAKDLENCEVFAGYKGDVFCEVEFEAHKVHAYAWYQSGTDYGPPSLRNEDYDTITQTFQDDDLKDKADETSNEGSKSAASAKKEAGNFLSKLGMQDLVERGECECGWIGFNNSEEGNDYQTATWGYIYSYATGIDGITFKDGLDRDTYLSVYETNDSDTDDVTLPDSTLLTVTDDGIIDVQLEYPVNVTQIYKDVELIYLKNIEQIIKAEITENPDKYDTTSSFNKLQLGYLKIRSDSEPGKYSYVPAWALSRMVDYSSERNAIFVNAIDGTIIDLENSL
ncbi:MAG: DUF6034 family protein [Agathobacter sp.]|uniref:DUF6034 family protein n=1 Tax=Agathobacter sp. TaxID=2021311 RepID=UPI003996ACA2